MKIKHYNDAIDWLTRPKFNGGGSVKNKEVLPKRKPEEELKKRKKKRFEKLKEYLENPEEVEEMLELQEGGRIGFDKGGIAKVVEYINSLPDGTEVSTKDIRDFIEKNNVNASPTSIRNIIAGSAPGRERFKDTIKFVDQKGVVKFNEETFKKIDDLLEDPEIKSFRDLGEELGYKTPKPSGKRGVTVGGGTPLSRNSAIIKAYVESRGGDPFEVFKVGAYKRGQPLVEKVLELQAKGDSTNTIAQKLFKGNRTNVRRIFRLFRPEAIKLPTTHLMNVLATAWSNQGCGTRINLILFYSLTSTCICRIV